MESDLSNAASECLTEMSEDEVLCTEAFEQGQREARNLHLLFSSSPHACVLIYHTTNQGKEQK